MKIKFMYDTDYDSKETLNSLEMELNIQDMSYWEIRGYFDTFIAALGIDNPEETRLGLDDIPELQDAFVKARYPDE